MTSVHQPLRGVRVLSLALNLPGPAALMRLHAMGATCVKLEPLPPSAQIPTADPMGVYKPAAYATLHQGVKIVQADLKQAAGQRVLQRWLARTDVLLTSFRPSALRKLGLDWPSLHKAFPALNLIRIVGAAGARAEEPGHDLTYQAEHDLVPGLDLPASLFADMAGSLMATEATLQVLLQRARPGRRHGQGVCLDVSLADAAAYLALPRQWGLTQPDGDVGGAHAGYRVYTCKNGRVAVAALEPHFALRLCEAAGLPASAASAMRKPSTHAAVAQFLAGQTRAQLERLATQRDIPLLTLPR